MILGAADDRRLDLGRVPSNVVQFSFDDLGNADSGSGARGRRFRGEAATGGSRHMPPVGGGIGPRNWAHCKVRPGRNFAGKVVGLVSCAAGEFVRCWTEPETAVVAAQRLPRFFVVSCAFLLLLACERTAPAPEKKAVAQVVKACPAGYSVDPPRGALEPGIRAFRDRRYGEAQRTFTALAQQFPESATTRVWLADSILFDRDLDGRVAAEKALPIYDEVGVLHGAGCKLPRRPRYYHLMDAAYARLRLAQRGSDEEGTKESPAAEYDAAEVQLALGFLALAIAEFPTSAEVPYTEARAQCALVSSGISADASAAALTACQHKFADALRLAGQLQRPRFLRTHRSMQDWIVRSRTQSELGPLRATPEYERTIAEALESSPLPIALTPGE